MKLPATLGTIVTLASLFAGTMAHAQMTPDKKQAIEAVIDFRKAFVEGRMADALAMSPQCVLDAKAKAKGMTADALLKARHDETGMIRLLAKSNAYVFQTDVSRHEVAAVSPTLKLFKFNATAQLGATMPVKNSQMVAINDGTNWTVAEANTRKDRKMLADCFADLKAKDLK